MFINRVLSAVFFIFLLGTFTALSQEIKPAADHHLHIRSEAASEALVTLQKEMTGREIPQLAPTGSDQIIEMLNNAGIEQGALLSVAYFFGAPDVDFSNELKKVKQENDYVSNQAATYPDRLVAFCSVNPLADYAEEEIRRCSELPQVVGLKLHLANSNIDLRNKKHVQKLSSIFQISQNLDMAIVIHLFTRNPNYGKKDASIFVNEVLPEVPNLHVQVAHLGGAGSFNDTTAEVMDYFQEASTEKPNVMDEDVVFDLSATVVNPEIALARGDTSRAEEIEKNNMELAKMTESFNADRLIFGTDWVAVSRKPAQYSDLFRSLPIKTSVLNEIFKNKAPYFERD